MPSSTTMLSQKLRMGRFCGEFGPEPGAVSAAVSPSATFATNRILRAEEQQTLVAAFVP
jgi:hypothetical protein